VGVSLWGVGVFLREVGVFLWARCPCNQAADDAAPRLPEELQRPLEMLKDKARRVATVQVTSLKDFGLLSSLFIILMLLTICYYYSYCY
jgi:hypothetical protein